MDRKLKSRLADLQSKADDISDITPGEAAQLLENLSRVDAAICFLPDGRPGIIKGPEIWRDLNGASRHLGRPIAYSVVGVRNFAQVIFLMEAVEDLAEGGDPTEEQISEFAKHLRELQDAPDPDHLH